MIREIKMEALENQNDRLYQRIICSCPKLLFFNAADLKEANDIILPIDLSSLLYVVHLMHIDGITYEFDSEAQIVHDDMFSKYRSYSRDMNDYDTFIR
jgi:hypothetical protein